MPNVFRRATRQGNTPVINGLAGQPQFRQSPFDLQMLLGKYAPRNGGERANEKQRSERPSRLLSTLLPSQTNFLVRLPRICGCGYPRETKQEIQKGYSHANEAYVRDHFNRAGGGVLHSAIAAGEWAPDFRSTCRKYLLQVSLRRSRSERLLSRKSPLLRTDPRGRRELLRNHGERRKWHVFQRLRGRGMRHDFQDHTSRRGKRDLQLHL